MSRKYRLHHNAKIIVPTVTTQCRNPSFVFSSDDPSRCFLLSEPEKVPRGIRFGLNNKVITDRCDSLFNRPLQIVFFGGVKLRTPI